MYWRFYYTIPARRTAPKYERGYYMALTRKMLKGMGLTDEQIDSVIDAHTETVDALKSQIEQYKTDADKLGDVQKKLDENDDWKAKHDTLKKAFDQYKAEVTSKETLATKQKAYKALLTAEKIPEKYHDRIIKMTDFDGMELDGDKLKDEASARQGIKDGWGEFIGTNETHGASVDTPPANPPKTITRADVYKKDEHGRYIMSTEERQKALTEHPELLKG